MMHKSMKLKDIAVYVLGVLLIGLAVCIVVMWNSNSRLQQEVTVKNDMIANLYEQNAKLIELSCALNRLAKLPEMEACLDG